MQLVGTNLTAVALLRLRPRHIQTYIVIKFIAYEKKASKKTPSTEGRVAAMWETLRPCHVLDRSFLRQMGPARVMSENEVQYVCMCPTEEGSSGDDDDDDVGDDAQDHYHHSRDVTEWVER
eukprot:PhF_6_TR43672/c0_g1_i2/m.67113